MNRQLLLSAASLVAAVTVAACSSPSAALPSAQPSVPVSNPVATPVATLAPTPVATPLPSHAPAEPPTSVDLQTATGHHVSIELLDESRRIVAARSGRPGDGASVAFGTVVARNLDARTIELTWADTPGDAQLGLYVDRAASLILVIRPDRGAGDAIAFDRVLVVEFDRPIDASALTLGVQEGLDTMG
jgi:hypothetical protein